MSVISYDITYNENSINTHDTQKKKIPSYFIVAVVLCIRCENHTTHLCLCFFIIYFGVCTVSRCCAPRKVQRTRHFSIKMWNIHFQSGSWGEHRRVCSNMSCLELRTLAQTLLLDYIDVSYEDVVVYFCGNPLLCESQTIIGSGLYDGCFVEVGIKCRGGIGVIVKGGKKRSAVSMCMSMQYGYLYCYLCCLAAENHGLFFLCCLSLRCYLLFLGGSKV